MFPQDFSTRLLKTWRIVLFACCAVTSCASPAAEQSAKPSPALASGNNAFSRDQLLETWGWLMAQENDVAGVELSSDEIGCFMKGANAGFQGKPVPYAADKIFPDVEQLAKERREKLHRAIEKSNLAEATDYFGKLKQRQIVEELPDGVFYELLRPGTGDCPKSGQTVDLHYTGRLLDGTEFTQFGPLDMVLVTNHGVCRGWVAALQKLKPGGALKLYVPPPLAEGDDLKWGIPPGSAMVFDIELLGVKDTAPQDLADALVPPAPELPPPPPSGFSQTEIIETWGWQLGRKARVADLGLNDASLAKIAKGLEAGVKNQPPPCNLKDVYPAVGKFVSGLRDAARLAFTKRQAAETDAFFAGLSDNTNVMKLPSGLCYEILKSGYGPFPKSNQRVYVNYIGRLLSGRIFDRTDPTLGPLDIDLDKVVPGWTEGMQKVRKGGTIKLFIPPSLGYGDRAVGSIPPGSTLVFKIELLDIKEIPKAATDAAR